MMFNQRIKDNLLFKTFASRLSVMSQTKLGPNLEIFIC